MKTQRNHQSDSAFLARPLLIVAAVAPLWIAGACSSAGSDAPPSPELPDAAADAANGSAEAGSTPTEIAGSRLKPLYKELTGSDGSLKREFHGWYDAARDEACTVQTMSDGKLHCAPSGEVPALGRNEFFADAACTEPVIGFAPPHPATTACKGPQPPRTKRYVDMSSASADGCPSPTKLAAFPATTKLTTMTVYRKSAGGSCSANSLAGKNMEVFASPMTPAEIDPADFVLLTASEDAATSSKRLRVSRSIHTGADGSKAVASTHILDGDRNELCWNQVDVDGEHRCMPRGTSLYSSIFFSDPGCTQEAVYFDTQNPLDADARCIVDARNNFSRYMTRSQGLSCQARTEIFPIFATPPLSTVYAGTPGKCDPNTAGEGTSQSLYAWQSLPSPIGPNNFATLAHAEHDAPSGYYSKSGARLTIRQSGDTSPDGFESMESMVYFDNELGTHCVPTVLEGGSTHCVSPVRILVFGPPGKVFANAACTESIVPVPKVELTCRPGAGGDAKLLAAAATAAGSCGPLRLYNPGPKVTPTTFYMFQGSVCTLAQVDVSRFDVYRESDLVTVSRWDFVELTTSFVK